MKANASTNTEFGIDNYRKKKISSLKSLFMPYYRFQLLFEKTIMTHNNSNIYTNNKKIDFSKKSIFVYHYNYPKLLDIDNKKSISLKNIKSNISSIKSGIKKKNNTSSIKRHLFINETINSNNNERKDFNNMNAKTTYKIIKLKNFSNSRNGNINLKQFPKTTGKKKLFLYSYKKKINYYNIKKKLDFNDDKKKISVGQNKKGKLINIINDKKTNYFLNNQNKKSYRLKKIKI